LLDRLAEPAANGGRWQRRDNGCELGNCHGERNRIRIDERNWIRIDERNRIRIDERNRIRIDERNRIRIDERKRIRSERYDRSRELRRRLRQRDWMHLPSMPYASQR
jgi:hypothetical protein